MREKEKEQIRISEISADLASDLQQIAWCIEEFRGEYDIEDALIYAIKTTRNRLIANLPID